LVGVEKLGGQNLVNNASTAAEFGGLVGGAEIALKGAKKAAGYVKKRRA
jgi:hypothetical protein